VMIHGIEIDTSYYKAKTGKMPRGRGMWTFMLVTDRITEKDHYHNPGKFMGFAAALGRAVELAKMRRAYLVRVMP